MSDKTVTVSVGPGFLALLGAAIIISTAVAVLVVGSVVIIIKHLLK